ncbi:hypothetical protein OGAPHI_001508 [Ogataea philodendri]|uniref:Secreted protein n=1 Tax=Ogataea philodendri TaxID=1378263 RepID=A0A9P8PDN5_9ASCO|nr:uncharacterized protein OGAPHI_001508 [Ogataea philodendri]KAH3669387.1 hypothetical protein OGAPHI_001508 [Ogataea philodendri]
MYLRYFFLIPLCSAAGSSSSEISMSSPSFTSTQSPSMSSSRSSDSDSGSFQSSAFSWPKVPCSIFHLASNSSPGMPCTTLVSTPYCGTPLAPSWIMSIVADLPLSFLESISGATSLYSEISDRAACTTFFALDDLYSVKSCSRASSIPAGFLAKISRIVLIPAAATSAATPSETNSSAILRTTMLMVSGGTRSCDACAEAAMICVTLRCFGVRYLRKNEYTPKTVSLCVPTSRETRFIIAIFWSRSNLLAFLLARCCS